MKTAISISMAWFLKALFLVLFILVLLGLLHIWHNNVKKGPKTSFFGGEIFKLKKRRQQFHLAFDTNLSKTCDHT